MGLPWWASSRGLALERGVNNVGPMAASVVKALEARGLRAVARFGRCKGVTTVFDAPLDEAGLLELAAKLKARCGTGGTVKDGRIEIQGDQRDRLAAVLEGMGYRVKRVGG